MPEVRGTPSRRIGVVFSTELHVPSIQNLRQGPSRGFVQMFKYPLQHNQLMHTRPFAKVKHIVIVAFSARYRGR